MAAYHSALKVTDPSLSLASQLPQGFVVIIKPGNTNPGARPGFVMFPLQP
jgi:hypothetical protein